MSGEAPGKTAGLSPAQLLVGLGGWEAEIPGQGSSLDAVDHVVVCPTARAREATDEAATTKKTLRECYMEAVDQAPPESPIIQQCIQRILQYREYEAQCTAFLQLVRHMMGLLDRIEAEHIEVWTKTSALNANCEMLLSEQMELRAQVENIRGPLEYFNELERIGPLLGVPITADTVDQVDVANLAPANIKVHPGSPQFLEVLNRIMECLQYFEAHAHFRDSAMYHAKMAQLYNRALAMVKYQVLELVNSAAKAAKATLGDRAPAGRSAQGQYPGGRNGSDARHQGQPGGRPGLAETGPAYSKFRAVQTKVNQLIRLVHLHYSAKTRTAGLDAPGRALLLTECHQAFFEARLAVLRPIVQGHLEGISRDQGLMGLARVGSAYLSRLCVLERQLFLAFFAVTNPSEDEATPSEEGQVETKGRPGHSPREGEAAGGGDASKSLGLDTRGLHVMLVELCGTVYSSMRPFLIQQHDLDSLCSTVAALQEEVHTQKVAGGTDAGEAVETVLSKLVQDAQERIIYCTLLVLRDDIENFHPTTDDLDYPAKLLKLRDGAIQTIADPSGSTSAQGAEGSAGDGDAHRALYAGWYPPLRSTLILLSKIYHAVENSVFEDLAGETVGLCTDVLGAAASRVSSLHGSEDGDLFLIKHLLTLREQLTPFDINFSQLKRRLDFSSTRQALSRFMAERGRVFAMTRQNALLSLAKDGLPQVDEQCVDARKELEEALKSSCNHFIQKATSDLAEPLVAFSTKARALSTAAASSPARADVVRPAKTTSPLSLDALKDQPFASSQRVGDAVATSAGLVALRLKPLVEKMLLYLDSAVTRSILFKPIQRRVLHATQDARVVAASDESCSWSATLTALERLVAEVDLEVPTAAQDVAEALEVAAFDTGPAEAYIRTSNSSSLWGPRAPRRAENGLQPSQRAPAAPTVPPAASSSAALNATPDSLVVPSPVDVPPPTPASEDGSEGGSTPKSAHSTPAEPNVTANGGSHAAAREAARALQAGKLPQQDHRSHGMSAPEPEVAPSPVASAPPEDGDGPSPPGSSASSTRKELLQDEPVPSPPPQPLEETSTPSPRARLVAFYKKFNPEKLDMVDSTLAKFTGREEVLFQKLSKKYGVPISEC